MPEYKLFDFQEKGIQNVSKELQIHNSVLCVSPTGSGKAVILSTMSHRFTSSGTKDVIIFVHKRELLNQTRQTLLEWYGIFSQKVDAKTTVVDTNCRVFVCMVETFSRRSESLSFLDNFKNIGLAIYDEAHLNSFTKVMLHFWNAKRVGFTATPISAVKKFPLKDRWAKMIIIAHPEELIALNESDPKVGIVRCDCWAPKSGINRNDVKKKGDDFDEDDAGDKLGRKEQIQNTLNNYLKFGYGKRTIIFNSNIKHSIKVYEAFKEYGLNVRHFDSDKRGRYGGDAYRDDCLKWLSETPDAILCNVSILTTGFDLRSLEFIMINRFSNSIPLIIQITGRVMRAYIFPDGRIKYEGICVDMCGNFDSLKINPNDGKTLMWEEKFLNPKLPTDGISPVKFCPECGAMNSASTRICLAKVDIPLLDIEGECGYIFPVEETVEDLIPKEMVRLFQEGVDVKGAIEIFKDKHEFASYYNVLNAIAILAHREIGLDPEYAQLEFIFETAYQKAREWFKAKAKHPYRDFRQGVIDNMCGKLKGNGFELDFEMVAKIKSSYKKQMEGITI